VGGYFGTRLAVAGNDVTFVARGRHLEAIRRNGLEIRSPLGAFRAPTGSAVASISELGPVDLVIVAVKLWDTDDVAKQLRPAVESGARVISLQNGVHKDMILRRYLPDEALMGGACYISAFIEEPGTITHNGTLQKVVFGDYQQEQTPLAQTFLAACRTAGIEAEISSDIERLIWEKFVFLVGLSATTTAIRQPIGAVRAHPRSRALLRDLMAEVVAVGQASGVGLDEKFADDRLAFCDTLPAGMTSSMHNDLEHGNRLELPWLSGGVVELASRTGISVPRNQAVADILAPYELGRPARD
jgi:2-dehydropantoate 2-reductase